MTKNDDVWFINPEGIPCHGVLTYQFRDRNGVRINIIKYGEKEFNVYDRIDCPSIFTDKRKCFNVCEGTINNELDKLYEKKNHINNIIKECEDRLKKFKELKNKN